MYKIPTKKKPAHVHPPKRRVVLGFAKTIVAMAASLIIIATGLSVFAVTQLTDNIKTIALPAAVGEELQAAPEIASFDGEVNMLVMASDTRAGQGEVFGQTEGELADVIMLLHVSASRDNAVVISFPRDLMVDVPECTDPTSGAVYDAGFMQINSTLGRGGPGCTLSTVQNLTGMTIPFVAEIDFNGVIEMSNAVGGVEVCLAAPISDENTQTYLEAGNHTLSGLEAVQFLRTRHGVGDGSDLGRIGLQQVFLSALARKVKSDETLTNLPVLYQLAKAATTNVSLSPNLAKLDTLVSLAKVFQDVSLDDIVFLRAPVTSSEAYPNRVVIDPAAGPELFALVRASTPITVTGDNTGVGSTKVGESDTPAQTPAETTAPVDPSAPALEPPADPDSDVLLDGNNIGQKASDVTCTQ